MDPIRTLAHPLTDLWGLAAGISLDSFIPREIRQPKRTASRVWEGTKDLYGGLFDPVGGAQALAGRDAERQAHHASDTAQAEAERMRVEAEAAEAEARRQAGQARLTARRRRGFSASLFASGLGLFAPAAGPSGKTLVGE